MTKFKDGDWVHIEDVRLWARQLANKLIPRRQTCDCEYADCRCDWKLNGKKVYEELLLVAGDEKND